MIKRRSWLTSEVENKLRELMEAGGKSRRNWKKLVELELISPNDVSDRTIYTVMKEIEAEKKSHEGDIFLGFEVPSGEIVHIPLHHLIITGMTQLSGKTTTIEALIHRSGLRAVVFKTKRGEKGFESAGKSLPLYFKERSDWQYVSSLIEATLREKVKFERSWVIRACEGTKSLDEVYNRVVEFLKSEKLRAIDKSMFTNLKAYLELILPEIKSLPTTEKIKIGSGVNVMDLESVYHRPEVQALVIRSVMEHILEKERNIIVVVPECWKFLPQGRNTPVKVFFERFIREGATIGNYLWLDSQDIAGVDKTPLRQVDNWILGRQRESHEVDRTLEAIPLPKGQKPSSLEIRRLKLGHFYAACGDQVKLVYVLPVGIEEELARQVAMGEIEPLEVKERLEGLSSIKDVVIQRKADKKIIQEDKFQRLERELKLNQEKDREQKRLTELHRQIARTNAGLQEILSSPQKVLDFTQNTVGESDDPLVKHDWRTFKSYYNNQEPSLDEGLFDLVGARRALERYEDSVVNIPLEDYISNLIYSFILKREKGERKRREEERERNERKLQKKEEERQKTLQKKWEQIMLNITCIGCGKKIFSTYKKPKMSIKDVTLHCGYCNYPHAVPCPNCQESHPLPTGSIDSQSTGLLRYGGKDRFYCVTCRMEFKISMRTRSLSVKLVS